MTGQKKRVTPESTRAWGLALYPLVILSLVVFMIVSNKPVTTDIIGLFTALIAAGSLQAAVLKKGGESGKPDNSSDNRRDIHNPGQTKLEPYDWRGPDDSDRWRNSRLRLRPN